MNGPSLLESRFRNCPGNTVRRGISEVLAKGRRAHAHGLEAGEFWVCYNEDACATSEAAGAFPAKRDRMRCDGVQVVCVRVIGPIGW